MKHEYTFEELAELKKIYDESGEAAIQIGEMRALRKAGLLTNGLPPKPEGKHEGTLADHQAVSKPTAKPEQAESKHASTSRNQVTSQAVYDSIASVCAEGHVPTIQKIADMLHVSKSTVARHALALAEIGRISKDPETGRYHIANQPTEKKETIMTVASKPVANKEEPMSQELTANKETAPEEQCENPRTIISNALTGIFDAISALQRTAFQTNDKVVYGFATKLLNGELMDLKANYSKDVAK